MSTIVIIRLTSNSMMIPSFEAMRHTHTFSLSFFLVFIFFLTKLNSHINPILSYNSHRTTCLLLNIQFILKSSFWWCPTPIQVTCLVPNNSLAFFAIPAHAMQTKTKINK